MSIYAGLWMIRWDPTMKIGIIRCENISKEAVIASMSLLRNIEKEPVIFHTRKTGGTIKKTLKIWKQMFTTYPPKRKL